MLENVKRGIELLNKKSPGWRRKVKPENIRQQNGWVNDEGCGCVLAQVYGTFDAGVEALRIAGECASFGFVAVGDSNYPALDRVWQQELSNA